MARAKRICPKPNCPKVVNKRYCVEHEQEYEAKRGTKRQRGYDAQFNRTRKWWEPRVELGLVDCWRCGKPLEPGITWHLGHDDDDRTIIRGPECPPCNLSAAGKASHKYDH